MLGRNRLTETQRQGMSERINQIVQLKCKERQAQQQFSSTENERSLYNLRGATSHDSSWQANNHQLGGGKNMLTAATPSRSIENSAVKTRGYPSNSSSHNTANIYNSNSKSRGFVQPSLGTNQSNSSYSISKGVTSFGPQEYFDSTAAILNSKPMIVSPTNNSNHRSQEFSMRRFEDTQQISLLNQQQVMMHHHHHQDDENNSQSNNNENLFIKQIRIQENRIAQLEDLLRKEVLSFEESRSQLRILKAELLKSHDGYELAALFKEACVVSQDEQVDVLVSLRQIASQISSEVGSTQKNDSMLRSLTEENIELKRQTHELLRQISSNKITNEIALKKHVQSSQSDEDKLQLKKQLDEIQKVCVALEKQVEDQAALLDKKNADEQEIKKLQLQLRERGNRLIQVECTLKEEKESLVKANIQIETNKHLLKSKDDEIQKLMGSVKSIGEENVVLKDRVEALKRIEVDLRQNLEQLQKEVNNQQPNVDHSVEIQTLKEKNLSKAQKISDLEIRIHEEKHQSTVAAVAIAKLTSENQDLKRIMETTNASQTSAVEIREKNMVKNLEKASAELVKVQSELAKAQADYLKAQEEIKKKEDEKVRLANEYEGKLQTIKKENNTFKEEQQSNTINQQVEDSNNAKEQLLFLEERVQQFENAVIQIAEKLLIQDIIQNNEGQNEDPFTGIINGIQQKITELLDLLSKQSEDKENEEHEEKLLELDQKIEGLNKDKFILETFIQQVKQFVPNEGVLVLLNEYCECIGSFIDVESRQNAIEEAMSMGENLEQLAQLAQETNTELSSLQERKDLLENEIAQRSEFESQKYALAEDLIMKQQQMNENMNCDEQQEEEDLEDDDDDQNGQTHQRYNHEWHQHQQNLQNGEGDENYVEEEEQYEIGNVHEGHDHEEYEEDN